MLLLLLRMAMVVQVLPITQAAALRVIVKLKVGQTQSTAPNLEVVPVLAVTAQEGHLNLNGR